MHLPILATLLLEFFAEAAHLVRYWLADGRTAKEVANGPDAVWRGALFHESGFEQEFAELLERRLEFAHGHLLVGWEQGVGHDEADAASTEREGAWRRAWATAATGYSGARVRKGNQG